jgi:hypothetical protein
MGTTSLDDVFDHGNLEQDRARGKAAARRARSEARSGAPLGVRPLAATVHAAMQHDNIEIKQGSHYLNVAMQHNGVPTMPKPTTPTVEVPVAKFKVPEFKLPKVDIDALFASYKANLAVLHEAQNVLVDAAQAIAKVQHGFAEETVADIEAAFRAKEPKKPEAVMADIVAAGEKAAAVAKQSADLAVAAQRRVSEQLAGRFAANLDEFKALAA